LCDVATVVLTNRFKLWSFKNNNYALNCCRLDIGRNIHAYDRHNNTDTVANIIGNIHVFVVYWYCDHASECVLLYVFFASNSCAKYSDEGVCMSVCLSVCLSVRSHISKTTWPTLRHFLRMLRVAVVLSSSGDNAIRYISPFFVDDIIFSYNRTDHSCFCTFETRITIRTTRTILTRVHLLERIPQPRHIDIGTVSLPAISKCVRVLVHKY